VGRTIAIVNQKGGVGKTTTAVNLAAGLAIAGKRILLIDADPQANATRTLGYPADPKRVSFYDVLVHDAPFDEVRLPCDSLPTLTLIPSDRNLVGAEIELVGQPEREYRLRKYLRRVEQHFDYVLLDCPPSLGLLTLNSLTAADSVLVPLQCEYLALEGVSQLMDTIELVRAALNPRLAIQGVVMTMYDERTNLARQVVEEVRGFFGDQVYKTVIPRNIRLSEAPSYGKPIFLYDNKSKGADAYLNLCKEFLENETQSAGPRTEQSDSEGTAGDRAAADPGCGAGPASAGPGPNPS